MILAPCSGTKGGGRQEGAPPAKQGLPVTAPWKLVLLMPADGTHQEMACEVSTAAPAQVNTGQGLEEAKLTVYF